MGTKMAGLLVTGECIGNVAKESGFVPQDAKFRSAYFDPERNAFVCLFEDESFQSVSEGLKFPMIEIVNVLNTKNRR